MSDVYKVSSDFGSATRMRILQDATEVLPQGFGGSNGSAFIIKDDRSVWMSKPIRDYGLASGGPSSSATLRKIEPLRNVVTFGDQEYMSDYGYALETDGTVWIWEWSDLDYILGHQNHWSGPTRATRIDEIGKVKSLSSCIGGHTVAVKFDGTVWEWRIPGIGHMRADKGTQRAELGKRADWIRLKQVEGINSIVSVQAVAGTVFALNTEGEVWIWGKHALGSSAPEDSSTPTPIPGATNIASLHIHSDYGNRGTRLSVLALKSDGTVWGLGDNSGGLLGDGTQDPRTNFAQVAGISGVKMLDVRFGEAFALRTDGTVWSWGGVPQLDEQSTSEGSLLPQAVKGLVGVNEIIGYGDHGGLIALRTDGTVWGLRKVGQTPIQIPGISRAVGFIGSSAFVRVEGSSAGCYIATAIYGSYDSPQVLVLRKYRDERLARSAAGRLLIQFYYQISPHLVRLFGHRAWFNSLVRPVLNRVVSFLESSSKERKMP